MIILLAGGADGDATDANGLTPLYWAEHCYERRAEAIRFLEFWKRSSRKSAARGPKDECPVCGLRMKNEGAPMTLSCGFWHSKLSYYLFDNSYATLSRSVALFLQRKGYHVEKAADGDRYDIAGPR